MSNFSKHQLRKLNLKKKLIINIKLWKKVAANRNLNKKWQKMIEIELLDLSIKPVAFLLKMCLKIWNYSKEHLQNITYLDISERNKCLMIKIRALNSLINIQIYISYKDLRAIKNILHMRTFLFLLKCWLNYLYKIVFYLDNIYNFVLKI